MKKLSSVIAGLVASAAMMMAAGAHASPLRVAVRVGAPAYVDQPHPAYVRTAQVWVQDGGYYVDPYRNEEWRRREWQERQLRERQWREREWQEGELRRRYEWREHRWEDRGWHDRRDFDEHRDRRRFDEPREPRGRGWERR